MEIHSGLVGCGEQGAGKLTSAESAHHAAGLIGAIPDFYEVMVGLGGEVQELDVSSWEQDRQTVPKAIQSRTPCATS